MTAPIVVIFVAFVLLCLAFSLRVRRWARGRAGATPWIDGLAAAPRRYLVHVHDVVSREPRAARMHVWAAGGFVASIALTLIVHGVWPSKIGAWLLLAALAATWAGAVMVLARRQSAAAVRWSQGSFNRLPWALMGFSAFLVIATLPLAGVVGRIPWRSPWALVVLVLGAWSCFELIVRMGMGPMKHALNGVLHLAWHPRPGRFEGDARSSALIAPDLQSDPLGVAKLEDFAWPRLLQFDACVECGKCEAACPAFAAGLPLNPKALIQDIAHIDAPLLTPDYAGNGHPNLAVTAELSMLGLAPETIWACTTCRACVEECPMMIEHVDVVIDARRAEIMRRGAAPAGAAKVLLSLRETDQIDPEPTRLAWASDLNLKWIEAGVACDVLLWAGASTHEARTQRTLRAFARLLQRAGCDFAILGEEELDCGDVARRLGDEATFQRIARANIEVLSRYSFKRIVTCDPHALHCLRNEYPVFGGDYKVLHHTSLLDLLYTNGGLPKAKAQTRRTFTYHDPCYLGRYNGEYDAPRRVLDHIGVTMREMERRGPRSFCCGGGGGAPLTDIPGDHRISDMRMAQANDTGAEAVAVACPGCTVMLEGARGLAVFDIAELALESVEAQ